MTVLNKATAKIEFFGGVLLQVLVVKLVAGEGVFVDWNDVILNSFLLQVHQIIFPN